MKVNQKMSGRKLRPPKIKTRFGIVDKFCLNKYYLGGDMVSKNSFFFNLTDQNWDMRDQYKEDLNTEGVELGGSTH